MKKLVLFLFAILAAVGSYAQSSLVATLTHDGQFSTFYSSTALKDAYTAAEDGDIITLSSGTFQATDFKTKKVTVRGTGMLPEEHPTIINGQISIESTTTDENKDIPLSFEGVIFSNTVYLYDLTNANFLKCSFNDLRGSYRNILNNVSLIHCFVYRSDCNSSNASMVCVNCYLKDYSFPGQFTNCTFENAFSTHQGSSFTNCLFRSDYYYSINDGAFKTGCVYVGPYSSFFGTNPLLSVNNREYPKDTPVFKEDSNVYELLDELTTTWLGNDGTQVGIHGGSLPFSPYGTNPRISKFEVSPKTTPDGKISIDIEVSNN